MKENFLSEIEHLLAEVPREHWDDPDRCGLRYQFVPWSWGSSVTVRTRGDDPRYFGDWKYCVSAESDCSRIRAEVTLWRDARDRVLYHRLLVEAAEALLSVDLTKYILHMPTTDGICLYHPFPVEVYDPDGTFTFNYCEFVMARRLESAEPTAVPAPAGM